MPQKSKPDHVKNSGYTILPLEDYDDYWVGHPTSCEAIEEEDDEEMIVSSLVGPNGEAIRYHAPSSKQGYIGFVPPDYYDHIRQQMRRRPRKRKARRT